MGPQFKALFRDVLEEGAGLFAGRVLLVAAPAVLAAAAAAFLGVAAYGALRDAFGPRAAALTFAAVFAALALVTLLVGRVRVRRHRRRAAEARARLAQEISALRAVAGARGAVGPLAAVAAFAAAFALSRRK